MALDPTISLGAKVPTFDESLKPIASLLGIQGAAQQLQTGRLQQQQLSTQLQERENLSKIDWNQYRDKSGNLDPVAAGNAAMQAAPAFYGPQIAKQMNELAKDSITMKKGLQELNQSQLEQIGGGLGALAGKQDLRRNDVMDWASQFIEQHPGTAPLVMTSLKYAPQTDDPKAWQQWAAQQRNMVLKPNEQGNDNSFVNTGGQTNIVSTNKFGITPPQVTGSMANTVAPMQREEIQTDALGKRYIVERGDNGAILNTRPVPGSYDGSGGKPPGSGPVDMAPGAAADIEALAKEREAARAAANQAPVMHDLNRQIIAEADKGFATGKLGSLTQGIASYLGYQLSGDDATNYNVLGKLLERSALTAAQGMGPHTNAGLEAQVRANGSMDYDQKAIRKIAVLNDALTSGAENYRNGLENAINAAGGNVAAKRQYDQDFAKNFDPRIMRLQNAQERGDKQEIDAVMTELGGPKSKATQDLLRKAQNLHNLITTGHL